VFAQGRKQDPGTRRRTMRAVPKCMFVWTDNRPASGAPARPILGLRCPAMLSGWSAHLPSRSRFAEEPTDCAKNSRPTIETTCHFASNPGWRFTKQILRRPSTLSRSRLSSSLGARSGYQHRLRRASPLSPDLSTLARQTHVAVVLMRGNPVKLRRSVRSGRSISYSGQSLTPWLVIFAPEFRLDVRMP
jgi:hypothetical protein